METTSPSTENNHSYNISSYWDTKPAPTAFVTSTATALSSEGSPDDAPVSQASYPPQADYLPFFYPHQSIYQAQLLHYNKLISPTRGGGLQSSALPAAPSPTSTARPHPRSRSSSKVSLKETPSAPKISPSGGHGSRPKLNSERNRPHAAGKDPPTKMTPSNTHSNKSNEQTKNTPIRSDKTSTASATPQHNTTLSSSVPSTPRHHARKFSFESREPSPNDNAGHSPRSVYSETNGTLPSLRPLPPKSGGCKYETALTQTRRRVPYTTGNERLERLDLRTIKSQLSEQQEAKLSTDMREMYNRLLPTSAVAKKRKKLVNKLERMFNDEWPGHNITVHVFGSSGNLLCHDASDVDICITTEWKEMENVCKIAELLARRGMQKVVCIAGAKVPIVKIWDPDLQLACDMNVNNPLALENTRMIRIYMEIDPRVRELAMIIKHWTRQRIINDAGIGGTLSSYTWICLIIAFLQLRDPPLLPSLHKCPHKLTKSDGTKSAFADDLSKLKGFGRENASSPASLLFEFFRFYAHEFDYSKHVLSIRTGRLLPKTEKRWDIGMTNSLCVEEPFNTSRNLGNTADEYSFRGLHQELRRAFDLISDANLDEACEQFVFPKEEERVFTRPATQSRPVLLRSSSQSHRGGRGGNQRQNRHNNFHRNGANNRRASSSVPTHDPNSMFMSPIAMAQDMSWYSPHYAFQYTQQDLITQMAYQENMRQLYSQAPFMQQNMSQRSNSATSLGQASERSRTGSFDLPPLTATAVRPDVYSALYNMAINPSFYPQYATYPHTPVAAASSNSSQHDFQRSTTRSALSPEAGGSGSGAFARSQSQPASRSPSTTPAASTMYPLSSSQAVGSASSFIPRSQSGFPMPSFMSDELPQEEGSSSTLHGSPQMQSDNTSQFGTQSSQSSQATERDMNGLAFGDITNSHFSPSRRRLSTDQLPQSILDRRIRRQSRSPSPMGHARTLSSGTASVSGTTPTSNGNLPSKPSRPMIVNGSGLRMSVSAGVQTPSANTTPAAGSMDNPLGIANGAQSTPANRVGSTETNKQHEDASHPRDVYGGNSARTTRGSNEISFRERIAMLGNLQSATSATPGGGLDAQGSQGTTSLNRKAIARQTQNGVIAPLDLALGDDKSMGLDSMAHLSPVYETTTPSPTVARVFDAGAKAALDRPGLTVSKEKQNGEIRSGVPLAKQTTTPLPLRAPQNATERGGSRSGGGDKGHSRGARSESDGGWHKASKGKKRGKATAEVLNHGERPPRLDSERKGG